MTRPGYSWEALHELAGYLAEAATHHSLAPPLPVFRPD
jgi:hypothetical protein